MGVGVCCLDACGLSPPCPGRSVKIRIRNYFCVFMNTGMAFNAPLGTGEVGLPDRPTDRPGYVWLASTIPNSHAERRLARRFSSAQISRSPQILLCSLVMKHLFSRTPTSGASGTNVSWGRVPRGPSAVSSPAQWQRPRKWICARAPHRATKPSCWGSDAQAELMRIQAFLSNKCP